jgi:hypothetical protein
VFLPKSRYAYHVGAYFHLKMHAKLDLEMRNGHKAEYMNDNEQSASCSATLFFILIQSRNAKQSFTLPQFNDNFFLWQGNNFSNANKSFCSSATILQRHTFVRCAAILLLLHYS